MTPTGSAPVLVRLRTWVGRNGIGRPVVALLLAAYALAVVVDLVTHTDKYQWDFAAYYWAGQASRAGLNPYELDSLTQVAGKEVGFPFAYSPIVLPAFSLLSNLNFGVAYQVFLALKLASLTALLFLWTRMFLDREGSLPFLLLCALGFSGTIFADLTAGNISVFEQLGLWLGFVALRRNQPIAFGVLVIAASLFKLTPILFLLLLLVPGLPRRWGVFLAAMGAFVAVNGLTYLIVPDMYQDFLSVIGTLDDRGAINPSTLALLRDLGDWLTRKGVFVPALAEWLAYAAFAGGIAIVTWLALRRRGKVDARIPIALACLAFALMMPRFKNYAYILLLPAAYYVLLWMGSSRANGFGLVLLLLSQTPPVPFGLGETARNFLWGYYPWFLAFGLWAGMAMRMMGGEAEPRTRPPGAVSMESEA